MGNWIVPPGPVADGLRIGLLGGSFNPAHAGHLYVSLTALKRLQLDYVWWLVSPQNPLKPAQGMAGLQALGSHYTDDTVRLLQRRFPQVEFVWLMGSDNLAQFSRWRHWQSLARRVP